METDQSQPESPKNSPQSKRLLLGVFLVMVLFFAGVFVTVLLPTIVFRPTASGFENTYTATDDGDPARGRQIYIREGCVYCHSQFVRPQDRGLGPVSTAGDFVFETPNQLGTARTGPDLSNEGKRYPNGWQRAHLINPRLLKPGSIMPSFSYLKNRDIDDLVAYIQSLGNRRRTSDAYQPPKEYERFLAKKDVDTSSPRAIQAGRGLYIQNCASCHGIAGRGNGSASVTMLNKPANFTLGKYKNFSDLYWFFRISEGVPGAGMPAWGDTLSSTERWNLVSYLKTLGDPNLVDPPVEVIESLPAEMRHTHQQWDPPVPDQ